jgi:hypothetical protein
VGRRLVLGLAGGLLIGLASGCASQSEAWGHMRAGLVELRTAVREHEARSAPAAGVEPAGWAAEAAAIDSALVLGIEAAEVGEGEDEDER